MIGPETSLRELAFLVCNALDEAGIVAVLTGGSAATVYAPDVYQSRHLDFVLTYTGPNLAPSSEPLLTLGFAEFGGTYRHQATHLTVEFPPGPLAVGDDVIEQWDTLVDRERKLHILNPTDCVRDRLTWFFQRVTDYAALEQALGVARSRPINMDVIRQWSLREKSLDKFETFLDRLQGSG